MPESLTPTTFAIPIGPLRRRISHCSRSSEGHFSDPHKPPVPQSGSEPAEGIQAPVKLGGSSPPPDSSLGSEADAQCKRNVHPVDNKTTPELHIGRMPKDDI
ncbi:hypothetical protein V2G26_015611 [Clonostachys chloroleuca]